MADTTAPKLESEEPHNNTRNEIDELFDLEQVDEELQLRISESAFKELEKILSKQHKTITNGVKGLVNEINTLKTSLEDRESSLSEMNTWCRDLTEKFYEREVLLPVIVSIIGIADRCRLQIGSYQNSVEKHTNANNPAALKAATFLIEAREGDLRELESTLANLGVERFQHHKDEFDPSTQICVNRIPCTDQGLHQHVAQHLTPGYKRHEKVIRKEQVDLYIYKPETT